ncbi:cyclic nucleotidebinding domain containing protein [Acanthamoeba castellanii str. Neff]|uniref:Cyclic nucleotidebinding domain containing protein n=1 Tax=Acanthamoeba castellanii (strain ATCC 30010 / Neff) TaxID=1257118 RepID=L8H1U8_ACACF|nr:cyclic nucleotidebinding domain containing protein [Acanthamoeba castellanii str. Neff]ELR19474.1 cyclic nucleotidebinding domain containing protein [Acanthamoeba castellanii str. Neff]
MENPYTQQPPFDNGSSTGYPAQQSQYAPESHNLPPVPQQQHYTDPGAEAHGPGCGGCGRCAGCGTWLATSGAGQLLADLTGHLCRSRPLRPLPSALSFLSEEDGQERPSKVPKQHHDYHQQHAGLPAPTGSAPEVQANRVIFVEPMEGEGGDGASAGLESAPDAAENLHFEGFETVNFDTNAFATPEPAGRRRRAIFGESVEPAGLEASIASLPRPHPKSAETQQALEQALKTNVMFSHLERDDRAELFDAMFEVRYGPGDTIINQGDEGDNFYVVESGTCEVWKSIDGNEPELVLTIAEGGSFGELALIYGTQRAASVKARTAVVLWAIHRSTYRRVLMGATLRKRSLYESFLKNVPILAPLERYERLMVADALEPEIFDDGASIITQGEVGDAFYIIVEGQVRVTQGEEEVARLGASAYFGPFNSNDADNGPPRAGEIALLTNQPRRATVAAVGATKCAKISRKKFFRVMGPCQDVLKHNMLRLYPQYAGQL